ncbi:STAS domain-containing protein [Jiella pacifica]|uniref:STAS domain-containing protein n=1 Tax=Jiella pacifica TaxID=2696469 RepID=A0A6N9T660_9HYPH|nr:STAS domain-containing protein [Jiella pacifica]NDW06877.1 STAS domain-containing protein [Jiella pacifica]
MSRAGQVEIESPTDESRVFELAGDCNIRNVAEVAAAFQQCTGDLLVDARGLTGVDVAVLQLLVSARKSTAAGGRSMRVAASAGGALDLAVERAGLSPMLRDVLVPELP